jgi:hypothetical protein
MNRARDDQYPSTAILREYHDAMTAYYVAVDSDNEAEQRTQDALLAAAQALYVAYDKALLAEFDA